MGATLDGLVEGTGAVFEAKFMLPWSFSEEGAATKYMAQLQHNMWVVAATGIATDGVQQDVIKAHMWLDLAAAHAPPRSRDFSVRMRDALATKMTRGQLGVARQLALQWVPVRERPGVAVAPAPE